MRFPKPLTWKYMPLYEKIAYYTSTLDERYSPYVDKLTAKSIVASMTDDVCVAPVVRVLTGPDDVHESDMNPLHIVKSTHGSGWNTGLTTVEEVREKLHAWNRPYDGAVAEKQYRYITPRFFIEEKVEDAIVGSTDAAIVYMFRCIHGNPVTIGVKQGKLQNSYDMSWKLLKSAQITIPQPSQPLLDRMITAARCLSAPFEFVRIDFYIATGERIYFSEFTFSPAGGNRIFPMPIEKELGRLWH